MTLPGRPRARRSERAEETERGYPKVEGGIGSRTNRQQRLQGRRTPAGPEEVLQVLEPLPEGHFPLQVESAPELVGAVEQSPPEEFHRFGISGVQHVLGDGRSGSAQADACRQKGPPEGLERLGILQENRGRTPQGVGQGDGNPRGLPQAHLEGHHPGGEGGHGIEGGRRGDHQEVGEPVRDEAPEGTP